MKEYIEREAAVSYIKDNQCKRCSDIGLCGTCAVLTAVKLFKYIPAADVVPVVRCKDCKHWSRMCAESYIGEPGLGKCRNERFFAFEYGFETEDNFTCADGKRKGE